MMHLGNLQTLVPMDPSQEEPQAQDNEMNKQAGAVCDMAGGFMIAVAAYYDKYINRAPHENTYHTPRDFVNKFVSSNEHCKILLRMNVKCFRNFVNIFKSRGCLENTIHCLVDEQIVIFLHTLVHNERV